MLFFFFLAGGNNLKKIKLDDIFYIKTGVLEIPGEEYYCLDNNGNQSKVRVLRMGSFDPSLRKIKSKEVLDKADQKINEARKLRLKQKKVIQGKMHVGSANGKRFIGEDKLLEKDDYLINTRILGDEVIINGYSLLKSLGEDNTIEFGPLSISHHFILLKPRKSMLNLSIPFLHMMLDILVDNVLPKMVENVGLIRSKELKEVQIQIPLDFNEQNALYEQYQKLKDECTQANQELEKFKSSFISSL